MRIGITGVPGTGKSTLAKMVAEEHGLELVDISAMVNKKNLWTVIDPSDDAKIVNLIALARELKNLPEKCVIESHLLCEMELPLDKLIVLRTPLKALEKRLEAREYNDTKIRSNLYSELLDYCTHKSMRKYRETRTEIYEVLTRGDAADSLEEIKRIVKGEAVHLQAPWVDISREE